MESSCLKEKKQPPKTNKRKTPKQIHIIKSGFREDMSSLSHADGRMKSYSVPGEELLATFNQLCAVGRKICGVEGVF